MQSFGALFKDNEPLAITLILLTGIISIAILIFLYRLLFGRRLHMAGNSRTRQPRLGVVDAFDLDRQRQLVLVRRDNVEHLIMIGGPNDVVIESAFVRMTASVGLPGGRDKEAGPSAPMAPMPVVQAPTVSTAMPAEPMAPLAATIPTVAATGRDRAAPVIELGEPLPPGTAEPLDLIPAPAAVSLAPPPPPPPVVEMVPLDLVTPVEPEPLPEVGPVAAPEQVPVAPAPTPPVAAEPDPPPPPRPVAPMRPPSTLPPRPVGASSLPPRPPLPPRTPTQASALPPRNPTLGPRPMPTSPLTRGTSAASLRRDPPPTLVPATPAGPLGSNDAERKEAKVGEARMAPPTAPAAAESPRQPWETPGGNRFGAAPPAPERQPVDSLPTTLDTLESLEEEMARLLGRPPSAPGKS